MWSFRDWRRKRILARLAIEPALWQSVLDSLPILDGLTSEETERLRERSLLFLHAKRLTALPGVELEPADRLRLAAPGGSGLVSGLP
jgi:MtfA peptidase